VRRQFVVRASKTLHRDPLLDFYSWGSDAHRLAYWWNQYALALILPRSFPDYVSVADIEATTRHVVATEYLPWEVAIPSDFGCYKFRKESEPP